MLNIDRWAYPWEFQTRLFGGRWWRWLPLDPPGQTVDQIRVYAAKLGFMHLVGLGPVCPLRAHPPGRFPLPHWLGQGTRNQTGIRARSDFFWLQKSICKEYIYILHLNARNGCNFEFLTTFGNIEQRNSSDENRSPAAVAQSIRSLPSHAEGCHKNRLWQFRQHEYYIADELYYKWPVSQ